MTQAIRLALCLFCFGLSLPLHSEILATSTLEIVAPEMANHDPASLSLASEDSSILLGAPFWVALQLKIDPNWHAYWKNPGDTGMAPSVEWHLPEGFTAGDLQWPTPKKMEMASIVGFGYDEEVTFLALITPPAKYSGDSATIGADMRWLVCSDSSCQPGESQASLTIPIREQAPVVDPQQRILFNNARMKIPQKNNTLSASRKDDLIQLSFKEQSYISKVEFYPENKDGVDYNVPPLFITQPNSDYQHTIVLKEMAPNSSLKGILILQTAKGTQAYDVDLTLNSTAANEPVAMDDDAPPIENITLDDSFAFDGGLPLAIAFGFIGGLILNLMPCVLPVISLKIMSFIKLAGKSRRLIFQHSMAFTGGVLISFWVLALLLLSLQSYGRSVGWGFQLQEPIFVAILAALLFVFSLSLFGLFEMGTSLIGAASQAQQGSGKRNAMVGSFLSGVLATAVATPCTGPFLGTAVGFAVTLPAYEALMIFTSLGLGMSLPYLLLGAFPALLKFLPKPGPWMGTFKELMGFIMLASVLWLIWVFSAQTTGLAVSFLLASFFLMAIAGWIYGKWGTIMRTRTTRIIGRVLALILFVCGGYLLVWSASNMADEDSSIAASSIEPHVAGEWEAFSPERVAELRKQGTPVFIDFTSKWCLICQANHLVLSVDEVAAAFEARGVVKMKADWTKHSEVITAELKKFGRNSVPLYILYGSDSKAQPEILPQVLTPEIVISSINKIGQVL